MQLAFYFDQTRCAGCYACVVACKDWHDVPTGPVSWRKLITIEKGVYPHPSLSFLSTSCYHCAEPTCAAACPVGAITKREEDGIVLVDREICVGHDDCDMCLEACPYGAPQFAAGEAAKMEKCDLCWDRLQEGRKPICVDACPMRALDAGALDELVAKYGKVVEAQGFAYDDRIKPSVVFKPKVG